VLDAGATRVGASSGIAMLDQFAAVTGPSAGA
jgi:deoxyribose-phosphate aldolase